MTRTKTTSNILLISLEREFLGLLKCSWESQLKRSELPMPLCKAASHNTCESSLMLCIVRSTIAHQSTSKLGRSEITQAKILESLNGKCQNCSKRAILVDFGHFSPPMCDIWRVLQPCGQPRIWSYL